jgi:hypothetical protein
LAWDFFSFAVGYFGYLALVFATVFVAVLGMGLALHWEGLAR